jgi:hypothetical protein
MQVGHAKGYARFLAVRLDISGTDQTRLQWNRYIANSVGSGINSCDLIKQDPPDDRTIADLRW